MIWIKEKNALLPKQGGTGEKNTPASGCIWLPAGIGREVPAGCWGFSPLESPSAYKGAGGLLVSPAVAYDTELMFVEGLPVPCQKSDHPKGQVLLPASLFYRWGH